VDPDPDRAGAAGSRRRFEQWLRNPRCDANVISAVLGKGMHLVAERLEIPVSRGRSPFALVQGRTFERILLQDGGARLLEGLRKAGLVPADTEVDFVDLRLGRTGAGDIRRIDDALAATRKCLLSRARPGHPGSWALLAGATVKIPGSPVMLPEALFVIDALLLAPAGEGRLSCHIGEIKSYPDRGGFTDRFALGSARSQAGIYVHALETVLADLGIDGRMAVERKGFLVLARPGSYFPSIRPGEDLRFMAERARDGFRKLRQVAEAHASLRDRDAIEAIATAPTCYEESCIAFCDLAPRCRALAEESGLPAVLGDEMERFLRGIDLRRARELMEGTSPPGNEAEADFVAVHAAVKSRGRTA